MQSILFLEGVETVGPQNTLPGKDADLQNISQAILSCGLNINRFLFCLCVCFRCWSKHMQHTVYSLLFNRKGKFSQTLENSVL